MVKIGLLGLPQSGKTTIFNAVTGSNAKIKDYISKKQKPNIATIKVSDSRLDYLSQKFEPEKTTYSTIEYLDFMGISKDDEKHELFSNNFLAEIRTVDSLAFVLRNFDLPGKDTVPAAELNTIEDELIFSDLTICEKRLDTIEKQRKRGVTSPQLQVEKELIEKCYDHLSNNNPLRQLNFSGIEKKILGSFQFLSQKPAMIILNESVENFSDENQKISLATQLEAVEIAGRFELELNELDKEEKEMFMQEYNIEESAINKLTKLSYQTLGLITFFTIGKDEVRAWALAKGSTALKAAEKVHTDLARGFIRAERFRLEDLKEYGSIKYLKEHGKFYLEGKDYIVKDGDIIKIRHN